MFITLRNKCNSKYPTIFVGVIHLALMLFRLYEIILDVYILEDLIEINQLIYLVLLTLLQLLIITSLFVGAAKENHFFLLPWLCFTAPLFVMSTSYACLYVATGDYGQSVINFLVIGAIWCCWYLVLRHYLHLKKMNSNMLYSTYKYSHLSGVATNASKIHAEDLKGIETKVCL